MSTKQLKITWKLTFFSSFLHGNYFMRKMMYIKTNSDVTRKQAQKSERRKRNLLLFIVQLFFYLINFQREPQKATTTTNYNAFFNSCLGQVNFRILPLLFHSKNNQKVFGKCNYDLSRIQSIFDPQLFILQFYLCLRSYL